jgi:hypothetical protein
MPAGLVAALAPHDVRTVAQMGWKGVTNGELLKLASERFDVLISMDSSMPVQQDLARYRIALVLVRARSNRLEALLPLVPFLERAITAARAGTASYAGELR